MSTKTINLKPEYAARAIQKFISDSDGTNHRYLSWEHCFLAFQKAKEAQKKGQSPDYDHLSLHLACYLSSWGMLRNSFLLKRDYRTHLGIVELLLSDTYEQLWTFPIQQSDKNDDLKTLQSYWDAIAKIRQEFINVYNTRQKANDPNHEDEASVTETLTTKILLGTCACIPATDRFYKLGVSMFGGTQKLGKKSYFEVAKYYWSEWDSISSHLDTSRLATHEDASLPYPPMKIMDMCFWQIGACIDSYDEKYYDPNEKRGKQFSELKDDMQKKYLALDEFLK